MSKRLTWRKQPNEAGLASIAQAERGLIGKYDGVDVLSVAPVHNHWNRSVPGWYFYGEGVNTCNDPVQTKEDAKKIATIWFNSMLAQRDGGQ